MGGRDSSSKRKSSKRKRDKISSKKKSKRKEPKKRRRIYDSDSDGDSINSDPSSSRTLKTDKRKRINKNKKRHHDTSLSSYSDSESVSSDSDSDNANKSRKARRPRVGLKDRKRKGRKRLTSIHSDVDTQNVRKRKTLDRDRVVKPIKKSSKKKSRKYSSSFSSSDSVSSMSMSSRGTTDGKRRRSKVIPDKEIERQSHKRQTKHEERSPSYSSCDRGNDPSDGALLTMNDSRRLRSVIAVVNQSQDEGENRWEMDLHNEEIVYDQNDHPSSKSVDSNEGRDRMVSGNDSHGGLEIVEKAKEIDVSVPRGDLLESILRQKALENLRKFKGRRQTGPRSSVVEMHNESDVETVDIVQNKSINQGSSNALEIDERKGLSSEGDISLMKDVKKLEHIERDDDMAKQSFVHPPNEATLLECSEEDKRATSCAASSTLEPSSSAQPISGEHSLEQGNKAKDGSQFEQKTMSVMRGGEVVQVSYKVFIPKKASPLARRHLRR